MTLPRKDFLRLVGAASLGPLALACGGGAESGGAGAPGGGAAAGGATAAAGGADVAGSGQAMASWAGYDDAVVIDALASPIQFNIPQQALPLGPADLAMVRSSGITALNLTVNEQPNQDASALERTLAKMAGWRAEVAAHPDVYVTVRTVDDIGEAKRSGRLGIIYGFQDAVPIEDDLDRLAGFYSDGLRIVQLTYNVQNRIGAGSLVPQDAGLTDLGREAVARMDELGVLVDLSHCGPRTTLDGIKASKRPVSITHSGCNAVFRHPRNKDDDTLRRLADRGGVIGIYLMPFLNASGPPSAEDVLRHLEHALDVCGEDHVGIGSDQGIVPLDVSGDFPDRFAAVSEQRSALGIAAPREDTIPYVPELNHPRRLDTIAGLLDQRGHPASVIEKVVGANFHRLFGEVWQA